MQTYILVLFFYTLTNNSGLTSIPGFKTEAACKAAGKEASRGASLGVVVDVQCIKQEG